MQKVSSLFWSNMIQNVAFWMQTFFNFWHIFKRFIQNLTRCKILLQNLTHREFPKLKSCFLKKLEKCKQCRFDVVTYSNTCFWMLVFLNSETFVTFFFSTYETFDTYFLKIRRRQNPNSKSCFLRKHEKLKISRFYDVK